MNILKYIYVAGPYEKPDPIENTRNAILMGNSLRKLGFCPFIPHLTLLWHLVSPMPVGFWYEFDNEWLEKCDAILRLYGQSYGADAEEDLAVSLGIPIFYSIKDLVEENNARQNMESS